MRWLSQSCCEKELPFRSDVASTISLHSLNCQPPASASFARLTSLRPPILIVMAITLAAVQAVAFEPPGPAARRAAVGDLSRFPALLHRAFDPDSAAFEPIPAPAANDWLNLHEEPGQTFQQFVASGPNRPDSGRRVIYFQPLGDFIPAKSPSVARLREFAAAFFELEVKMLPPVPVAAWKITTRENPYTGKPQLLTADI